MVNKTHKKQPKPKIVRTISLHMVVWVFSVVRTTFKVYGKRQNLTLSQPKTPDMNRSSPNSNALITSGTTNTKKIFFGSVCPGIFAEHISEIYTPPVRNLLQFYGSSTRLQPTGESVKLICMLNSSNNLVLRKKVLFWHWNIII